LEVFAETEMVQIRPIEGVVELEEEDLEEVTGVRQVSVTVPMALWKRKKVEHDQLCWFLGTTRFRWNRGAKMGGRKESELNSSLRRKAPLSER